MAADQVAYVQLGGLVVGQVECAGILRRASFGQQRARFGAASSPCDADEQVRDTSHSA